jgi:hypothetical protein
VPVANVTEVVDLQATPHQNEDRLCGLSGDRKICNVQSEVHNQPVARKIRRTADHAVQIRQNVTSVHSLFISIFVQQDVHTETLSPAT